MLYIVATPIGNLGDITLRAIEVLKSVDGVVCEDTRRTAILLNHYEIKKPMMVLNDFNESRSFAEIVTRLRNGENLALVSDAGTPLVSDPGYKLVRECLASGVEVDSIPGPSAVVTALTVSGLPPDKFMFLGYPPEKPGQRDRFWTNLSEISKVMDMTYIMFMSPYKMVTSLKELEQKYGDIEVTLAKDLTKMFQKVETKKVSEWVAEYDKKQPKGEWVMLLGSRALEKRH